MAVAEEEILRKLRTLPDSKQQEVVDFIEFLAQKDKPKIPRRSLLGALAHLNTHFTAEDLKEARREMWGEYMEENKP
jgi:hypothetical protein